MIDVELKGVTKKFGQVVAVNDVSLQVRQGEFLTLLGPSGCGKTTTMRLIAGLETHTAGEIFVRQENVTYRPPYKRDVSLMFQNYALFPHKNVFDNIAFGLKYRGLLKEERKRRVEESLELVHLPGMEVRYPRQLSGGQQQRIALARALVVKPAVLLLDEPLSNLDLKLREKMRVELKQIQEQVGITFVFVTHDQEEALMLSDRIAVMEKGQIVQLGTPREVYEKPRSRFVAEFVGQSNFLEGRVVQSDHAQAEVEMESGLRLHVPAVLDAPIASPVTVQIRAERILVHQQQPSWSAGYKFPGVIERSIYVGNTIQYLISLETHDLLLSIRPTTGESPLARGTDVWVTFGADDCLLLASEE
jgi:spermidine/putrescine transport system ATP-binding protein